MKINKIIFVKFWLIAFAFSIPFSSFLYRLSVFFLGIILFIDFIKFIFQPFHSKISLPPYLQSDYRFIFLPILLYLWVYLSAFWSVAPEFIVDWEVHRYFKLLMIPGLAYLLHKYNPGEQENILKAFLIGIVFLITPSFLDGFGIFDFLGVNSENFRNLAYSKDSYAGKNLVYHRNQIVHGFMCSILCLSLCIYFIFNKNYKIFFIVGIFLCLIDIFYLIIGRMAFIGLIAGFFALLICYPGDLKKKSNLFLMILSIMTFAILFSDSVQIRLFSIYNQFSNFWYSGDSTSSGGQRLHFWNISIKLFLDNPLFGAGAGAFEHYLLVTKDPLAPSAFLHAHSEYLTLLSLYGLVGFGLFAYLLMYFFKSLKTIQNSKVRCILFVSMCIFLFNALTDSSLNNEWEGWSFILFIAIVAACSLSKLNMKNHLSTPP